MIGRYNAARKPLQMAEFPFMPTKTAELIADTQHLTPAEFGAYWRLIIAMWRNGGYLPADDATIRKYSTLDGRSWSRSRQTILSFFEVDDDIITQKTVTAEYERAAAKSGKAADSARARWGKVKATSDTVSRHSVTTQRRKHVHNDPKPLETRNPDDAIAPQTHMRSQCLGDATYTYTYKEDDDDPRADARDNLGIPFDQVDENQVFLDQVGQATGVMLESEEDHTATVESWQKLDISNIEILDTIRSVRSKKGGRPPKKLAYFTEAMHDRRRSKLKPVSGGKTDDRPKPRKSTGNRADRELADDLEFAADLDRKRKGAE